ncbi:hypothetical protein HC928_00900 [bacterium]|nr:hypothetical protein [bacterium]
MAQPEEKVIPFPRKPPSPDPEEQQGEPRDFWSPLTEHVRDNPFFWLCYAIAAATAIWLVLSAPEPERIRVYVIATVYLILFPVLALWVAAIFDLWKMSKPINWQNWHHRLDPQYSLLLAAYGIVATITVAGVTNALLGQRAFADWTLFVYVVGGCVLAGVTVALAELPHRGEP